MLDIAKSLINDSYLITLYLPTDRLNWNKASGPLIRLSAEQMRYQFLPMLKEHAEQFRRKCHPVESEAEKLSSAENAEIYSTHLFVGLWQEGDELVVSPSEVTWNASLSPLFFPVSQCERVSVPWTQEKVLAALNRAFDRSSNRIFEQQHK